MFIGLFILIKLMHVSKPSFFQKSQCRVEGKAADYHQQHLQNALQFFVPVSELNCDWINDKNNIRLKLTINK